MRSSEKTIADPAQSRATCWRPIVKAAGMIFGNLDSVVFDPAIDCPPYACYNCWGSDHHLKSCREPKSREYCCNCGRRDARVDECARCARAFFEQDEAKRSWIFRNFLAGQLRGDEDGQSLRSVGSEDGKASESCRGARRKSGDLGSESPPAYTEPNDLFALVRASKVDNHGANLDDTMLAERRSFGEDSVVFDVEEEEEQKGSRASADPIHDFLNLMDAVKHLAVATQEVVVLQFMAERKKKSEMLGR